jgi:hypothetical protein
MNTLVAMQHIAGAHDTLGNPKKSLELREKALDVQRRMLGVEKLSTLETGNLAVSYHKLG